MKKLMAVLIGVTMLALCGLSSAETLLTDSEMSEIYAGDVIVEINEVDAEEAAVALQSNVGVIGGMGGVGSSTVTNENKALVVDVDGNSAAAIQNNIGGIASLDSPTANDKVKNTNEALVVNIHGREIDGWVRGESVYAEGDGFGLNINDTAGYQSAIASQSNAGIIAGMQGVLNCSVTNKNCAIVGNASNRAAMMIVMSGMLDPYIDLSP